MYQVLTTSELAQLLSCTIKTARERAKKEGFETVQKDVDGRELPAFKVPSDKLNELKIKVQKAQQKHSGHGKVYQEDNNYVSYTVQEPFQEPTEPSNNNYSNPFDKFLDYLRERDIRDKEKDGIVKEYIDRVINAEKQVKLLEDSENRSRNVYLEQIQELKYEIEKLKKENKQLKEQLDKKSGFLGMFRK
jgi:hypothetical protein